MATIEIAVLIPLVAVSYLNETHAALGKTPGHEALATEISRCGLVETVLALRRRGLVIDPLQFRCLNLHAVGQLQGADPSFQRGVRTRVFQVTLV